MFKPGDRVIVRVGVDPKLGTVQEVLSSSFLKIDFDGIKCNCKINVKFVVRSP